MVFEILTGLPGTGPWPEQFSATGLGTHSEGFVVRFVPDHGEAWIGNFLPGLTPWQARTTPKWSPRPGRLGSSGLCHRPRDSKAGKSGRRGDSVGLLDSEPPSTC